MTKTRPPIRHRPFPGGPVAGQGLGAALRLQTAEARAIHLDAFKHAMQLGHPYIGGEHFLLAVASADDPAAAVLREHEVTPERVEEQVVRLWGGGLFGDLDRGALAAIGIDVDAVRARVTGAFDSDALRRAGQRVSRGRPLGPWWDPRPRHVGPGMHVNGVFLPVTQDVAQSVRQAGLEAQARHDTQIRVVHLTLGLLSLTDGLVPAVVAGLGVSPQALRALLLAQTRPQGMTGGRGREPADETGRE